MIITLQERNLQLDASYENIAKSVTPHLSTRTLLQQARIMSKTP
jgi:hypothetical protein